MTAPVLEAPTKVEEARLDEGHHEESSGASTWVPLFGAVAAADPTARSVTLGADLRTKSDVLLQVQRTAGNRAATEWIDGLRPPTVTVARSTCCDSCADGGPCSATGEPATDVQPPEPEVAPAPSVQRAPCCDGCADGGACTADQDDAGVPAPPVQRTPLTAHPETPVQRGVAADAAAAVLSKVRNGASSFVAGIRAAVATVWSRIQGLASQVGARLRRAVGAAIERLGTVFAALRQRVQGLLTRVRAAAERAADRLRQGVDRIASLVRQGWEALQAGARGFLERIRSLAAGVVGRIKDMGRNTFGPMTGTCLDNPTAEAIRARFDGVAGPGEAEVGAAATTGLAGLTAQFGARDADGAAQMGGLESSAGATLAQTTQESDGVVAAAETGQVDLEGQTTSTVTELGGRATSEVTGAEGNAEAGAADVDGKKSSGVGGLRGLLGGLVAAVLGTADRIVSGASREADEAAGGLRGRFRTVLAALRELAASLMAGLRAAVGQVVAGVKAFVRTIVEQARALWKVLRDAWEQLKERGRATLRQLREWWQQLLTRATSGWRSLGAFLASMRSRAGAALFNTCGDACALLAAKRQGRQLEATEVPPISFKARAGGARRPADRDLMMMQAALEDGGQPLPASVRSPMEAAFGADLTTTRVHTGATAGGLASGMNARAFTIGDDIAFGHGEFQPGSLHGDALIAHEVAHVLQQRGATPGERAGGDQEHESEHDADHSAMAVVARMWGGLQHGVADIAANAAPRIQSGLALRRCPPGKCCEKEPVKGALAPVAAAGNVDNPGAMTLMDGRRGDEEGGDVYGLTGTAYGHQLKEFVNTKATVSAECKQTCQPNPPGQLSFSLSPFFFVAAGRYPDFDFNPKTGGKGARRSAVATTGRCAGKSGDRVTIVTEALAAKVKAAEVEHAHDLARAWDLSIAKYIAAVNELQAGFCVEGEQPMTDAKCTDEFRTRIGARSGINWGGWSTVADCLANQSKDRDTNKWHTVGEKTATKVGTKDCKEVEVTPDAAQMTNVGNHPTKEIVDDSAAACGAGGGP